MLAPSEYEGSPTRGYLDTATYGLPPRSTLAAVEQTLASWRERGSWLEWEKEGEACRELFARIVGAEAGEIAFVAAASVAAGLVAASLPVETGANVVLYERDFDSVLFPWRPLAERGVELRTLPLEKLADGIDERTALVAVSLVQSSDGRMPDLEAIKATGTRLFLDGTQAVGSIALDLEGVDYLVAHSYKWLLSPRGLCFFYVRPERLREITPWLAGWKSRSDPFEDYYGAPELAPDAHRLDISIPWFSAPGARASLELIAGLGPATIGDHNLALARTFAAELGLPEPPSPILRVPVEDAHAAVERLKNAGVACSARSGSIRFAFHLYNDEADVALALEALRPAAAVRSDT
ncbi:MAG TPA: aminotransferase class V-fold PLP-dependent enzyme [Gaiellaceae bacterium]|nr:aminotransferase class V-fold PLP-dependent enzyme [Gaiellaceae bacterium]